MAYVKTYKNKKMQCIMCDEIIEQCDICGSDILSNEKFWCYRNGEEHICEDCFKTVESD